MRSLRLQLADSLQQQAAGAFAQWQAGFIIAGNSFVQRQIGYAVKRRFGPAAAAVCLGGTTNYMQSPRAAAHSVVRRPPQLPQKAASQPHQTSALQASGNEAQGCPLIDRILVDMHTHATWKGTTLMDAHGRRRAQYRRNTTARALGPSVRVPHRFTAQWDRDFVNIMQPPPSRRYHRIV